MSNTAPTKKSPLKSVNFWATILTALVGIAGAFGVAFNPADAAQLTGVANDAVEAVKEKNWYLLLSLGISSGNFIWHTFIKPIVGK